MQSAIFELIDKKYMQLVDAVYYKKGYIVLKGSEAEEFYATLVNIDKKAEESK